MDGGDTELPLRPRSRPDCAGGPRPCPWVSCEHHALLARLALGNGKAPPSDDAAVALLEELPVSCVLDVVDAEPDGATLDVVGAVLGLTKERVRQIEAGATAKALARAERAGLDGEVTERDLDDVGSGPPRRNRVAVPVAEQRVLTPPPHLAHLPGPDAVREGETFWCSRIGAAVGTRLCGARRSAMHRAPAGYSPRPIYRECAECPEGAALAHRLAGAPEQPERRHLPVIQPKETMTMETTETKDSGAPEPCAAKGCTDHRAGVRVNTNPILAPFCRVHRRAAHERGRSMGGLEAVTAALRAGTLPPPNAAMAARGKSKGKKGSPKPAAKPKPTTTKPTPKPHGIVAVPISATSRPAITVSTGDEALVEHVTRALRVVRQLGGLERAERIAAAMGGA